MTTPFTFVGVPIDSVGRAGGTEHAPDALRRSGLVRTLHAVDAGDLPVRIRGDERDPDTGLLGSDDVLATTATVRDAVRERVSAGERLFLAGGCCTLLPGAIAGVRDAVGRVGLAYLDGHHDLYDGETSTTGEAADMPISVVLGRGPAEWVAVCGGPALDVGDVAVLGPRDLSDALADGMVHPDLVGIHSVDAKGLREQGPSAVGARAASDLGGPPALWVHLDVDVLDETVFPATDYPMPEGLELDELVELMHPLLGAPSLIGASVACFNPEKDPDGLGARSVVDVFRRALA